ncbi:hypothetical protein ACH492_02940 [Streptomyces sp. NPDC019443]
MKRQIVQRVAHLVRGVPETLCGSKLTLKSKWQSKLMRVPRRNGK